MSIHALFIRGNWWRGRRRIWRCSSCCVTLRISGAWFSQCLTANLSWSWCHVVCFGLILLQNLAEELCSLVTQCFQLVYTDATMRFLEDKVNEAAAGLSLNSSTAPSGTTPAAQLKPSVQSFLLFMFYLEPSSERPTSRFESSYENKHFGLYETAQQ